MRRSVLFSDFYYSRWNKTEDISFIKEAFKRLQTSDDFGIRFEIRKECVRFALCHISVLRRFFKDYITRMQRNENLLPTEDEDKNECIRLLKFSRQQDLILRYIFKHYEDIGERVVIIRTNFDKEIGEFYQLFCFEELLIDLELQGLEWTPFLDTNLVKEMVR